MTIRLDSDLGISATGNITTDNYFIGNGSQLTGLAASYSNANVATYLPTYTGNLVSLAGDVTTTANISGAYILGNGSQLTGLPASYGNANVAAYLPTYTGNLTSIDYIAANTIAANANVVATNILSATETVSGNLRAGNISSVGNVIATGVKTDNYMYANGTPVLFEDGYGNSNVQALLNSGAFTGDIIPAGNATQSLGSNTNQWLDLWVSNATIYLNSIPLGVSGNGVLQFDGNDIVTSGPNVINTGNVETTGNVVGGNIVIATGGGVTFADGSTQTSAYGNAEVEAYLPSSNVIIAINSNVSNTDSNVANLTSTVANLATSSSLANTNANVANLSTDLANTNSNVGNLETTVSSQANAIANLQGSTYSNANAAGFLANFGSNTISTSGSIEAGDVTLTNLYSPNYFANSVLFANATGFVTNTNLFKYAPDTEVLTVGAVSTTGNITVGTTLTAANIAGEGSAISNITGANVVGAVALATNANIAGVAYSVDGANVVGEVALANTVSNPNQPNITALGTIVSLNADAITANTLNLSGNAQFDGNVYFAANVTIPGNIIQISGNSGNFYGNPATGFGALYAGIPAGFTPLINEVVQMAGNDNSYVQTTMRNLNSGSQATGDFVITADNGSDTTNHIDMGIASSSYNGALANNSLGTSLYANDGYLYTRGNVTGGNLVLGSNQANGVVRIITNGVSNISDVVATFDASGLSANGVVSATGNVTGGNIRTAGLISATGNVTAGNVNTAIVSATGTVQAGNLRTAGLISATGNATAGNVITTGRVSATGNVYGGNVFAIAPAGASFNVGDYFSNGTIVTLDYIGIGQTSFPVGSTITITDGVEVPGLDGTYVITAASADQCSFLNNVVASTGNVPTGFSNTFPTVTGVNSAVISTSGNVVAGRYVLGDGSLLTNLPTQPGTYTNSNVATFLSAFGSNTISTTGNIAVGVASVAGNISAVGNISTANNVLALGNINLTSPNTGLFFDGNTLVIDSNLVSGGSALSLGSDTVIIDATANVVLNVNGNSAIDVNDVVVAVYGNLSATGNITAGYFIGDGSQLTGLPAGYSDSNVVTLMASFGSNTISTTGNVNTGNIVTGGGTGGNITGVNIMSANVFIGDGGNLTNLPSSGLVVNSMTSGANITASVNDTQYNVTALAVSANVTAPTGVAQDGQKLTYRIIDNGTPQTLTWDAIYQVIGTTLPVTTVANKYVYVGVIYNGQDTTWDVVSVAQQA